MSRSRTVTDDDLSLHERYDAIWHAAAPEVRAGRVSVDPWALRKGEDARRGVTLLARPEPAVLEPLGALLDELLALEPEQYAHPLPDLHVTMLSLFTATAEYAPHLAHVDDYRAAVEEAIDGVPPFAIDVRGATLSTAAVIAQGFPRDDTLERLRARLRAALTARGLGATLDGRYRLRTAHVTLLRFVSPLRDPDAFVDVIAAARTRALGTTVVRRLELVLGDWYSSTASVRRLGTYELGTAPHDGSPAGTSTPGSSTTNVDPPPARAS